MTMTFLARAKIELEHTCMEKEQYSRVRYSDKVFLLHFFPILMSTLVGWSPPKLAGKMSEMQQCTCVWFASLPIMPRLSPKNNNNKNPFFSPFAFCVPALERLGIFPIRMWRVCRPRCELIQRFVTGICEETGWDARESSQTLGRHIHTYTHTLTNTGARMGCDGGIEAGANNDIKAEVVV